MTDTQKTSTATSPETNPVMPAVGGANLPAVVLTSRSVRVADGVELTDEQRDLAEEIAADFDIFDKNKQTTGLFAAAAMQRYNQVLNNLLEGVRVGDLGEAGAAVSKGVREALREMRLKGLQAEMKPGTWAWLRARLPIIGKYLSLIHYFYQRQKKFLDVVGGIERQAKQHIRAILEYLLKSDRLIGEVETQYHVLAIHIVAGEAILERSTALFEAAREEARRSGDAMALNKVHAMHEQVMAFDERLLRIKQAYTKAPVTGQQIRLGQSAAKQTIQGIQNALDFTLSDLKTAVVNVAGLYNMMQAQALVGDLERSAAEVQDISQDMLERTVVGAKASQGRALEQVKQLVDLMQRVVDLTQKGVELDRQNAQIRKEAEAQLVQAMAGYKEALGDIGVKATLHSNA